MTSLAGEVLGEAGNPARQGHLPDDAEGGLRREGKSGAIRAVKRSPGRVPWLPATDEAGGGYSFSVRSASPTSAATARVHATASRSVIGSPRKR